ncbi:MAG: hypothetical protein OJF47_000986 [Nitrospira sp.]|nr:MAG: hypothetical protein OJF47_000986 [Nitrospira sp.]
MGVTPTVYVATRLLFLPITCRCRQGNGCNSLSLPSLLSHSS